MTQLDVTGPPPDPPPPVRDSLVDVTVREIVSLCLEATPAAVAAAAHLADSLTLRELGAALTAVEDARLPILEARIRARRAALPDRQG